MVQDPLAQMKQDFITDASETIQRITQTLSGFHPGEHPSKAQIDWLFRTAHSLKGTAGMFELHQVSKVAESGEDLLELVRSGRLPLDGEPAELLLEAFDEISALLDGAMGQDVESNADAIAAKISGFLDSLSTGTVKEPSRTVVEAGDPGLDGVLASLGRHEEHLLRAHIARGDRIVHIEIGAPDVPGAQSEDVVLRRLQTKGEIISILPVETGARQPDSGLHLVYALRGTDADLEEITRDSRARVSDLKGEIEALYNRLPTGLPEASEAGEGTGRSPELQIPETAGLSVKVDIGVLDSVMNTISELYSVRVGLLGIADRLPRTKETRRLRDDILKLSLLINKRVSALEESVSSVRLVPISMLFTRYRSEVRRLARSLGKQVRLAFEGEATLVDRALLERLHDPLLHIIRNAVAHGIEPSAKRTAKGKPAVGTISLRAGQEANHIRIDIEDDGRGIDLDRVIAVAHERGIHVDDETPPTALLFQPGFTTKTGSDSISGRGVGLDAVKMEIEAIRGTISVAADLPAGARFSIWVPLTLAVSRGVLLEEGDVPVVLPLGSVDEILPLRRNAVEKIEETGTIEHKDSNIPVVMLSRALGLAGTAPPRFAVVVGVGERRRAIATLKVCGETDIVGRPLPESVHAPHFVTGATELAGGRVAVVIQPEELAGTSGSSAGGGVAAVDSVPEAASEALREWKQGRFLKFLMYRSNGVIYATPLCLLKEVIQVRNITRFPAIGRAWEGLFFVRGMCHGLARMRGRGSPADEEIRRIVVCTYPERCGIGSTEVIGYFVVPYQKIERGCEGCDGDLVRTFGTFQWKGNEVKVLDMGGCMSLLLSDREGRARRSDRTVAGTEPLMRALSPDDT